MDEFIMTLGSTDLNSGELIEEVKKVNHEAGDLVAREAEQLRTGLASKYPSYGLVRIRSARQAAGAAVTVGPKHLGHAAEFGAFAHPVFGRSMPQVSFARKVWPLWSGSHEGSGYMVWPTIRNKIEDIVAFYDKAIVRATQTAFPEKGP